jgi:hypothetical protein
MATTMGTASNGTTICRFGNLGNLNTQERFTPNATTTAQADPPAANGGATFVGWGTQVSDSPNEQITYFAGDWTFRHRLGFSAAQRVRLTTIVYAIRPDRTNLEIGRTVTAGIDFAASSAISYDVTFNRASLTLPAGTRLQVEAYVQTVSALDGALAPLTQVDITQFTDVPSASTPGGLIGIPPFSVIYSRTTSDTSPVVVDSTSRTTAVQRRPGDAAPTQVETVIRQTNAVRRAGDTAPAMTDSVITVRTFRRLPADVVSALTDATTRVVAATRSSTESTTVNDTATRTAAVGRISNDAVPATADSLATVRAFRRFPTDVVSAISDVASRLFTARRIASDASPTQIDTATRFFIAARRATEVVAVPTDVAIKLVTYGRTVRYQFQPGDDPLIDVTKAISGIVRTTDGSVYTGGATVVLYRADTNVGVQVQISAANGSYSFPRNSYDTNRYYVAAFITSPSPQQAVSERILIPS